MYVLTTPNLLSAVNEIVAPRKFHTGMHLAICMQHGFLCCYIKNHHNTRYKKNNCRLQIDYESGLDSLATQSLTMIRFAGVKRIRLAPTT